MSVGFPPCPKCKASGCLNGGESLTHSHREGCTLPCPDCGGRGVLITDELVEATARGLHRAENERYLPDMDESEWPVWDEEFEGLRERHRVAARTVLVAVVEKLKENQQ